MISSQENRKENSKIYNSCLRFLVIISITKACFSFYFYLQV